MTHRVFEAIVNAVKGGTLIEPFCGRALVSEREPTTPSSTSIPWEIPAITRNCLFAYRRRSFDVSGHSSTTGEPRRMKKRRGRGSGGAGLLRVCWGTLYGAVGTEDAAVACLWLYANAAGFTGIKKHTPVFRHRLLL